MGTKTITVTEEAYDKIAREKKEGESFSELFLRIGRDKGTLAECLGLWSDIPDEKMKVFDDIERSWDLSDKELKKRLGP